MRMIIFSQLSLDRSFIPSIITMGFSLCVTDPYVKVWLQFGDKRIEKRKTPVYKCTLNPVFNETFTFNVPWEKIRECSLDVLVMDFDNIGRNELIGRIQLAGSSFCNSSTRQSPLCHIYMLSLESCRFFVHGIQLNIFSSTVSID